MHGWGLKVKNAWIELSNPKYFIIRDKFWTFDLHHVFHNEGGMRLTWKVKKYAH